MSMNYNAAFFGLFENVFKLTREEKGEDEALRFFSKLMKKGLSSSYGDDFEKGDAKEFVRLVGDRDRVVGLHVEFPVIEQDRIIYQFHDDPFPNLKGLVEHGKLDNCYMGFKVGHLLGNDWSYSTTKHFWDGSSYTEHVIVKV